MGSAGRKNVRPNRLLLSKLGNSYKNRRGTKFNKEQSFVPTFSIQLTESFLVILSFSFLPLLSIPYTWPSLIYKLKNRVFLLCFLFYLIPYPWPSL